MRLALHIHRERRLSRHVHCHLNISSSSWPPPPSALHIHRHRSPSAHVPKCQVERGRVSVIAGVCSGALRQMRVRPNDHDDDDRTQVPKLPSPDRSSVQPTHVWCPCIVNLDLTGRETIARALKDYLLDGNGRSLDELYSIIDLQCVECRGHRPSALRSHRLCYSTRPVRSKHEYTSSHGVYIHISIIVTERNWKNCRILVMKWSAEGACFQFLDIREVDRKSSIVPRKM